MDSQSSTVSLRSPITHVLLIACLALLAPAMDAQIDGTPGASLDDRVNLALDLTANDLFDLEVVGEPGQPIRATVPIEGIAFTLDLSLHSVRSKEHYRVRSQGADGSFTEHEPSPLRTMRGTVVEIPGSKVAATYDDKLGLFARIHVPDTGEEYWVEQVNTRLPDVAPDVHVIYAGSSANSPEGACGVTTLQLPSGGGHIALGGPACGVGECIAQLGCDADVEYYQSHGSSVTNVENKINNIINVMNLQYEGEVDITHEITSIVVRTANPDPYAGSSIGDLLNDLQDEWTGPLSGTPHDVAQLFTGQDKSGGVIGVAWLSAVCSNLRYSVVENFSSSLSCLTDLSAHELGHNWGAGHCGCPNNTMNSGITCANTFSAGSINVITNFRDSIGCLSSGGPPTANFSADKTSGPAPLNVRFDDDSTGAYTSWLWDFGDGNTKTTADPSNTYDTPGFYTVTLTVSGPAGQDTVVKTNYIDVGPPDPLINFTDLGGGTVGGWGVPELTASGELTAGTNLSILLTSTPGPVVTLAWLSFVSVPVQAVGGTIYANPPNNQFFFNSSVFGIVSINVDWPSGVPAGTDLFLQFIVQDTSVPAGITLSNGVTATTP